MTGILPEIARRHGTPFYVYFANRIRGRIAGLKAAFDGAVGVGYAAKANPHPAILRIARDAADALDVSSGGELERALQAGWPADRIGFTGPAKRDEELAAAVRAGVTVVMESVEEAERLSREADRAGRIARALVRLSPANLPSGFGVRMAGRPTRFGVDEEEIQTALPAIARRSGLDLAGFHSFPGTQCLSAEAAAANWVNILSLFRRAAAIAGIRIRTAILGAGLGIPYHEDEQAIDLPAAAALVAGALAEFAADPAAAGARVLLETGRYVVGEAGVYVASVLRVKESRGGRIAILDGGLHHHLAAAGRLGGVIPRNYPLARVRPAEPHEAPEPVDLAGPLCTEIDLVGHRALLPPLRPGDLVAIGASGAYGPTASPLHFIGHPPPKEILVETTADGGSEIRDVSDESVYRAS